jgi:peptidoglycan-associated lipoprotein
MLEGLAFEAIRRRSRLRGEGPRARSWRKLVPSARGPIPPEKLETRGDLMSRTFCSDFAFAIALAVAATACAKKPALRETDETLLTGARTHRNVKVSDELARLCKIQFANVDRSPKFDFDEASLVPEDRAVLEQVAKCVTEGPMKGRKLGLVGRADPRGDSEYNMILGEQRADSVRVYLARLGVAEEKMLLTSRGELDSEGKDEDGWKSDRRVDILLD